MGQSERRAKVEPSTRVRQAHEEDEDGDGPKSAISAELLTMMAYAPSDCRDSSMGRALVPVGRGRGSAGLGTWWSVERAEWGLGHGGSSPERGHGGLGPEGAGRDMVCLWEISIFIMLFRRLLVLLARRPCAPCSRAGCRTHQKP